MQSAWILKPQNLKTSKPQNLILVKTDILFCSCKKKSVYLLRKTIENRDCIGQTGILITLLENRESRTAQWRADMHTALCRVGLQRRGSAQILFHSEFHRITGVVFFQYLRVCSHKLGTLFFCNDAQRNGTWQGGQLGVSSEERVESREQSVRSNISQE